jgi:hypothetical protein
VLIVREVQIGLGHFFRYSASCLDRISRPQGSLGTKEQDSAFCGYSGLWFPRFYPRSTVVWVLMLLVSALINFFPPHREMYFLVIMFGEERELSTRSGLSF